MRGRRLAVDSHTRKPQAYRKGLTVMDMAAMSATEQDAIDWFESLHWPDGKLSCLRCGCTEGAHRVKSGKPRPYLPVQDVQAVLLLEDRDGHGVWSMVKRGYMGIYHRISPK